MLEELNCLSRFSNSSNNSSTVRVLNRENPQTLVNHLKLENSRRKQLIWNRRWLRRWKLLKGLTRSLSSSLSHHSKSTIWSRKTRGRGTEIHLKTRLRKVLDNLKGKILSTVRHHSQQIIQVSRSSQIVSLHLKDQTKNKNQSLNQLAQGQRETRLWIRLNSLHSKRVDSSQIEL